MGIVLEKVIPRKDKIGLEKEQEESEMGYRETYESWLNNPYFDEATRAELQAIARE